MSGGWGVSTHGLDRVVASLVRERDETQARAKQQSRDAARKAGSVLRGAAAARPGTVRTRFEDTEEGTRVSAVSNVRINRARLDAAARAGASVWEASDE